MCLPESIPLGKGKSADAAWRTVVNKQKFDKIHTSKEEWTAGWLAGWKKDGCSKIDKAKVNVKACFLFKCAFYHRRTHSTQSGLYVGLTVSCCLKLCGCVNVIL